MPECHRCANHGLNFDRTYAPDEFIEGNRNARVWIIGINPAAPLNWVDQRTAAELQEIFDDEAQIHRYFRQFRNVSETLYQGLGQQNGVAHTDLVKCSSLNWPPNRENNNDRNIIINNCSDYLIHQIENHRPEIIICNGSEVSSRIRQILTPPPETPDNATSYRHTTADNHAIIVILSGFIGRIDNYARRRLGVEIEQFLNEMR